MAGFDDDRRHDPTAPADRRRDPRLRPADRRGVRRSVQRSRAGSRAPIVGARSAHRCRGWRDRWVGTGGAYSLRADRARRGSRGGRDHHDRRHAESSAARDPAPHHALALRPGSRARRAGRRSCGRPKVRSTSTSGTGSGRSRARSTSSAPGSTFARPAPALGRIRLVDRDEAARLFPPIYEAVRVGIPGTVTRSEARWRLDQLEDAEWQRAAHGIKYRAVLEVDGEPRGYAIYRAKAEWGEMGPNNTVLVFEVVGLDAAAERAIWEWLAGIDLVGHIKGWRGPVPHPLMLQLTEPRRLGLNVREGMWLRLIDLKAALEARTYARRRVADVRGDRRVLPLERRPLAAGRGGRWARHVDGLRRRPRSHPRHRGPRDHLPRHIHLRRPGPCRPGGGVPARGRRRRGSVVRHGDRAVVLDDVLSPAESAKFHRSTISTDPGSVTPWDQPAGGGRSTWSSTRMATSCATR